MSRARPALQQQLTYQKARRMRKLITHIVWWIFLFTIIRRFRYAVYDWRTVTFQWLVVQSRRQKDYYSLETIIFFIVTLSILHVCKTFVVVRCYSRLLLPLGFWHYGGIWKPNKWPIDWSTVNQIRYEAANDIHNVGQQSHCECVIFWFEVIIILSQSFMLLLLHNPLLNILVAPAICCFPQPSIKHTHTIDSHSINSRQMSDYNMQTLSVFCSPHRTIRCAFYTANILNSDTLDYVVKTLCWWENCKLNKLITYQWIRNGIYWASFY